MLQAAFESATLRPGRVVLTVNLSRHAGGRARYVNHSCEPNCCTRIIHVGGRPKVVLYSKRAIEEGEELRSARSIWCACQRQLLGVGGAVTGTGCQRYRASFSSCVARVPPWTRGLRSYVCVSVAGYLAALTDNDIESGCGSYDYNFPPEGGTVPCHCGALHCRGYMA